MSEQFKYTRIEAADVLRQPGRTVTREAFFADPSRLVWQDGVQPEWIAEAYRTNEQFRANIHYALSRSVSKGGDFSLADGWLQLLAPSLSSDEVVNLYEIIRDDSQRLEPEWRAEFEAAFPVQKMALPPIDPWGAQVYWSSMLFRGIIHRDADRVREAVSELRSCGSNFATLPRVEPESIELGYELWLADGRPPEEGLTLLQVAERVDAPEIIEVLRSSGAG